MKRSLQSIVVARPELRVCDGTDVRNGWADRSGLLDWNGCSRTGRAPSGEAEEQRVSRLMRLSRLLRVAWTSVRHLTFQLPGRLTEDVWLSSIQYASQQLAFASR